MDCNWHFDREIAAPYLHVQPLLGSIRRCPASLGCSVSIVLHAWQRCNELLRPAAARSSLLWRPLRFGHLQTPAALLKSGLQPGWHLCKP